jgi:hypothetical protein
MPQAIAGKAVTTKLGATKFGAIMGEVLNLPLRQWLEQTL